MTTRISRTNGTPTLTTKCTFSAWVKRSDSSINNSGLDAALIETYTDSNNFAFIRFDGNDQIQIYGKTSAGNQIVCDTDAKFRDPNAWYHIVAVLDSTESTSSDRVKLYVNGELQTFQGSPTFPSGEVLFNKASATLNLGNSQKYTSNFHFDGQYSHVHFIDGLAYQASTFGETDSTTGEWKINTSPSVTYGTNGFFMFKDDASLNDDSGNGNNFTVSSGSIQKSEDCPSNVFATMSPIDVSGLNAGYSTLTNGNTRQDTVSASQNSGSRSTLAVNSGKWYVEAKAFGSASPEFRRIGILGMDSSTWRTATNSALTSHAEGYAYKSSGDKGNNGNEVSYANSYTNGDIVGIAFDADNGTIWFSKNGTWQNSATITEIQNGTTTNSAFSSIPMTRFYGFAATLAGATSNMGFEWNFGNGFFGTTAISSEGTNASGIGKFEYDVPTGYTALSTKGLNE